MTIGNGDRIYVHFYLIYKPVMSIKKENIKLLADLILSY